jgi:hypothetical protein
MPRMMRFAATHLDPKRAMRVLLGSRSRSAAYRRVYRVEAGDSFPRVALYRATPQVIDR